VQTWRIVSPTATHWRAASCAEVDCGHYLNGWASIIDESSDLGQRQAWYIRNQAGRGYSETRNGPLTTFTFEAGQACFAADSHQARTRPELYVVQGGDWRGNPRGTRRRIYDRSDQWVSDFADHQQTLADRLAQG
jgi:hypothetical protein